MRSDQIKIFKLIIVWEALKKKTVNYRTFIRKGGWGQNF